MTLKERFSELQRHANGSPQMGGGLERDSCGEWLWRDDVLALAEQLDREQSQIAAILAGPSADAIKVRDIGRVLTGHGPWISTPMSKRVW